MISCRSVGGCFFVILVLSVVACDVIIAHTIMPWHLSIVHQQRAVIRYFDWLGVVQVSLPHNVGKWDEKSED